MAQKRQRQNKIDVVKDFIEIAGEGLEKRFGSSPTCKDVVREHAQGRVVSFDGLIEVSSCYGDSVFSSLQLGLKIPKTLICL